MNALARLVARIAYPFLRIAMAIVLVWIGGTTDLRVAG